MKNDLGANGISILSIFTWLGFVGAISFMEAWIKFQAPGVTVEIGLGIGRLVFQALNKMEWVFCIVALIANLLPIKKRVFVLSTLWAPIVLVGILIYQTAFLLPQLDTRALEIIAGNDVGKSHHHTTYIAVETIKVIVLVWWGLQLLRMNRAPDRTD